VAGVSAAAAIASVFSTAFSIFSASSLVKLRATFKLIALPSIILFEHSTRIFF